MDPKCILAVFTTMLCLLQTASAQECELPTFEIMDKLFGESFRRIARDIIPTRYDLDINTTLLDFGITCLTTSGLRNLYKASSSVIEFSFTGTVQDGDTIEELNDFNMCEADTNCFALLNIECDDRFDEWIISTFLFVQSMRVLPDFNNQTILDDIEPRLDCGTCGEQSILEDRPNDRETNCFLCHEECQQIGLAQCTGLTPDDCCPFYENDTCITECSEGRVPNDSFDCVCRNFFLEPTCTECGLECIMGVLDVECSECICAPGFIGDSCNINRDDCEGVVCFNQGVCNDLVDSYECICASGFTADDCSVNIDDCVDQNCSSNGVCEDMTNGFQCNCDPDFTGLLCENFIDNCTPNPCLNVGACIDGILDFDCDCHPNFSGETCQTCILENCENCSTETEGVCILCQGDFGLVDGVCVDPCFGVVCQNGGTCLAESGMSTCLCADGFEGSLCETNINDCASNPCFNDGACIDGISDFDCDCQPNFIGETCQTCVLENCDDCSTETEGVCIICQGDFGLVEGVCVDPCSGEVCQNGGTCTPALGEPVCQCVDGFDGPLCGTNIDECAPQQCLNGAECVDGINSFECVCAPDFTGNFCDTIIDNCDPNVCLNGGTCVDGIESFTCICAVNFEGDLCETCRIENCIECSQEQEDVCVTCDTFFKPAFTLGCIRDAEEICSDAIDARMCEFTIVNQQYQNIATRCGLDLPDSTDIDDSGTPFEQGLDLYRLQANEWLTRAIEQNIDVTAVDPSLTGLAAWRAETNNWRANIRAWSEYYTDTLGLPGLEPLPEVNIDNGNPQEVYDVLTDYWSTVNLKFIERGLDQFCPLSS